MGGAWRRWVLLGLVLGAALGCASGRPRPLPQPVASDLRQYLLEPLAGFPLEVDTERRTRLNDAHRALLERREVETARRVAQSLLTVDPGFQPAVILGVETDLVAGDAAHAVERLQPIALALPGYLACQLLLGRAAEEQGDLVLAYGACRAASDTPAAAARADELAPRAREIVGRRFADALRASDLAKAEAALGLLRQWGPAELGTVEAEREWAAIRGDRAAELTAVRALAAYSPDDPKVSARRAQLELEVGDPRVAVELLERLTRRSPGDAALADLYSQAKFHFRLQVLPEPVRESAARARLDRADLATLLFWLVPEVRSSRRGTARIATDVLDDPRRDEIVRVVNLGLMGIDETTHRFEPRRFASRIEALVALARLLAPHAAERPCLAAALGSATVVGRDLACGVAVSCRLVDGAAACEGSTPLSGTDALELVRRTLELLGQV